MRNKSGTAGRKNTARGHEFGVIGQYIRDPFPAISHAAGAILSAVGTTYLVAQWASSSNAAPGVPAWAGIASLLVYGLSLIVLFTASAWSHTAIVSERASERLVRLDYAAIFLLIAGTYTPVCVLAIGGNAGWGVLAAQWTLAAVGMWGVMSGWCRTRLRVAMYVTMGWLGLVVGGEVVRGVGWEGIAWLVAGGVVYTVGAAVYVTDRPRLFPGRFVAHDLWHLMVLVAAALHFVAVRGIAMAGSQ